MELAELKYGGSQGPACTAPIENTRNIATTKVDNKNWFSFFIIFLLSIIILG